MMVTKYLILLELTMLCDAQYRSEIECVIECVTSETECYDLCGYYVTSHDDGQYRITQGSINEQGTAFFEFTSHIM